jgi:hypothetical protein
LVKRKDEAAGTGDWNMSQMHFARKDLVIEEMALVAHKEKIAPELVRSEIAIHPGDRIEIVHFVGGGEVSEPCTPI